MAGEEKIGRTLSFSFFLAGFFVMPFRAAVDPRCWVGRRESSLGGFLGEVGADELGHGEGPELVLAKDLLGRGGVGLEELPVLRVLQVVLLDVDLQKHSAWDASSFLPRWYSAMLCYGGLKVSRWQGIEEGGELAQRIERGGR